MDIVVGELFSSWNMDHFELGLKSKLQHRLTIEIDILEFRGLPRKNTYLVAGTNITPKSKKLRLEIGKGKQDKLNSLRPNSGFEQ